MRLLICHSQWQQGKVVRGEHVSLSALCLHHASPISTVAGSGQQGGSELLCAVPFSVNEQGWQGTGISAAAPEQPHPQGLLFSDC